jgi:hypothetical protein
MNAAPRAEERLKQKRKAIHCKRHYRALLARVAGVTSSTELGLREADAVLGALDRIGAPIRGRQTTAGASAGEWRFVFRLSMEHRCAQKIGQKQSPPAPVMPKAWVEGIVRQCAGYNAALVRGRVTAPLERLGPAELFVVVQILESWAKKIKA